MIPACYSRTDQNSEKICSSSSSSSSSQMPQNLVTCIYQTQLFNSPLTYLTLTWSKSLFSHTLTISAPDCFSNITISLHPTTLISFFRARPGSKSINLANQQQQKNQKVKLYWDFSRAKFAHNSAEPVSCFYIAITSNGRLEFLLGDMSNELSKRAGLSLTSYLAESSLLSRREHVFGHKSYVSRAQFMGSKHEIEIECNGGTLTVKVDNETRLVVKRLAWKFRGNERIRVGGVEVEFYWDVFNWLSKSCTHDHQSGRGHSHGGHGHGHGVFVFQVGDGGVWPEMVGAEKKLMRKSLSSPAAAAGPSPGTPSACLSPALSCSSVLQWAEESSDCGTRSSCSSTRSCGSHGGFSLLLYAWRN